ncbi:MAG: apolipoprotein N-acyltransferase [Legionella sp.]|nr:MAG: apolipoprotein N-acyltransferase [Legionella sp.]
MSATISISEKLFTSIRINYLLYLFVFFAGLLGPLGFAPFHLPGFTILSLAFLYAAILRSPIEQSPILGFIYGMAYFGLGVSWVIISIHDYGHIHYIFAGILTILFIMYLALYPAGVAFLFKLLRVEQYTLLASITFSALWCLSEYMRSYFMTGCPWLLVGTSLIDTPVKYLAPILGINGLSFLGAFTASLLVASQREQTLKRFAYLFFFLFILVGPTALKNYQWTTISKQPISIGAIQANLSMRDKWDEQLFWQLLNLYEKAIDKLLGKQLIILPESAIPIPERYISDYIAKLSAKAKKANSGLIAGTLQPVDNEGTTSYYNAILSLGQAKGSHIKYQLVPFGEYIPRPFVAANRWLNLPQPNIVPGPYDQGLIEVDGHPFATLICYEVAYPHLLSLQMPEAQWIVSLSDNGWFGKSLASFQQLQMSQMLSLLTGRYQVVVNNDGLSAIINNQGDIVTALPAFSAGVLQGELFPASGTTPWLNWSDYPVIIFCSLFIIFILILRLRYFRQQ